MWPPQWLTPVPQSDLDNGEGEVVIDFAETFGIITKDSVAGPAGQSLDLRDWQKELIRHVFAGDGDGYRNFISLIGMPRKNGPNKRFAVFAIKPPTSLLQTQRNVWCGCLLSLELQVAISSLKSIVQTSKLSELQTP